MEQSVEEDAQICRLCGQCESIYIDVFGEEGTKRYLGMKIHSRINIVIDESDPLPKAICVQCLGKLEFVCDFQEECLRTQELLRDRFNLQPLRDVEQTKGGDILNSPTNNNSIDKNRNSPNGKRNLSVESEDVIIIERKPKAETNFVVENTESSDSQSTLEALRTNDTILDLALQNTSVDQSDSTSSSTRSAVETVAKKSNANPSTDKKDSNSHSNSGINRWRRNKSSTDKASESSNDSPSPNDVPVPNPLRCQGNTTTEGITRLGAHSTHQNVESNSGETVQDMIQIPTSALNKVLNSVSNSPDLQVSVKESSNQSEGSDDTNFTVELCKKQNSDVVTVLAKVFPDQGSCMVDPGIVKLLENQNGLEIRNIVSKVIQRSTSNDDGPPEWTDDPRDRLSQNPEDLYKMDGEEIRVDENIEFVLADNQTSYICRLCRKKYERRDKCTVHVKTHLGIKQFVCTLCSAKFVCKSDVIKHIRCSHTNPRPIQCQKCPKRFRSKFDLTEHDNVHKGVKPYSCQHCGQSYHHKVSLQMHVKSHLPSQNLACEYCGKVFPFRTRLLSHIASVHLKDRRNFRCHFCYNLYSSLSVLNEHIKTRHTATHTCETCGKKFKVASKYKAHVLQHTNPKPFSCHVCNNKYASKAFLNEHLLKHEGVRNHVCQKCGATFAQASHLAAHRHVHGEKNYACPDCGKRFNRQDNMKVHRKRHFGPTRFIEKPKTSKSAVMEAASMISNEK